LPTNNAEGSAASACAMRLFYIRAKRSLQPVTPAAD